jgi:DNA polymerase V
MQAERVEVVIPSYPIPLYQSPIQAGFPSPAEDHIEEDINLQEYLVQHPSATFFLRVSGHSMKDAGIFHNDLIIVDSSHDPQQGDIVVAEVNGGFTVKTYHKEHGHIFLLPANPDYDPIEVTKEMDAVVWGVVTYVLHKPSHAR